MADLAIVITAANPSLTPVFRGVGSTSLIESSTHPEERDLILRLPSSYGISSDESGILQVPAHHSTLRNIEVRNAGSIGLKRAGVDGFLISGCAATNFGFLGADLIGARQGVTDRSTFGSRENHGPDSSSLAIK
jgi:hypothetical protein